MLKFKLVHLPIFTCLAFANFSFAEQPTPELNTAIPNNACGIVSINQTPPKTKRIYRVNINKVDGVVAQNATLFQLSPGPHKIRVIEKIQDPRFTRRRGEMKNFKDLEINVEANATYHLGAKFIRKNSSKLKTGEYWEPIIWKTTEKACKV